MQSRRRLPKRLYIIRHAKSLPNKLLAEAEASGAEEFHLPMPDHLAPIIDEGERELAALAAWILTLPEAERPTKVVSSTHFRTTQTSVGVAGPLSIHYDERFIERKWGAIAGLTHRGFALRFPEEAAKRARQGDFRYRPGNGGESLRDLKKRIKPALKEHLAVHHDENLVLVTHSQVILVLRQLLEKLTEKETQELDESRKIPNCSVCVYLRKGRRLELEHEYFVAPANS